MAIKIILTESDGTEAYFNDSGDHINYKHKRRKYLSKNIDIHLAV